MLKSCKAGGINIASAPASAFFIDHTISTINEALSFGWKSSQMNRHPLSRVLPIAIFDTGSRPDRNTDRKP
jgi:hypothetical protein